MNLKGMDVKLQSRESGSGAKMRLGGASEKGSAGSRWWVGPVWGYPRARFQEDLYGVKIDLAFSTADHVFIKGAIFYHLQREQVG